MLEKIHLAVEHAYHGDSVLRARVKDHVAFVSTAKITRSNMVARYTQARVARQPFEQAVKVGEVALSWRFAPGLQ